MCPCPVSPEDCSLSDEKGYMYTQTCSGSVPYPYTPPSPVQCLAAWAWPGWEGRAHQIMVEAKRSWGAGEEVAGKESTL